jgi:hypothetical protein
MCFDLIKESIVEKFEWFVTFIFMICFFLIFNYSRIAHKLGFVSEQDDQIDKDPQQYANFQYSQSPGIHMNKSFDRYNHSAESPPGYDYAGR